MNENNNGFSLGSFTLVHKVDLDGMLVNALILAAVYAGFRILETIITASIMK